MKRLLFLLTLFFTICIFYTANAQKLVVVTLDKDNVSFATPMAVNLSPGDTLQFVSINGDFNILITDAYQFLKIKEDNLEIRINSSTNSQSEKFIVRGIKYYESNYDIYCISSNAWPGGPDAPPKIIIKVN